MAWTYLLKSNIELLKYWINLYYSEDTSHGIFNIPNVDTEVFNKLSEIFINLGISDDMIAQAADHKYYNNPTLQIEILNELAKFGIFSNSDRNDLLQIIRRLLEADSVNNMEAVLTRKFSNLNLNQFNKLLVTYCISNNLFHILNVYHHDFVKYDPDEDNSGAIGIILRNYDFSKDMDDSETFMNNIFETAKFLSKDNLLNYFRLHPLILLSTIIFTKGISMNDLLSKRVTLKIKDFTINKETLLYCLKDYNYFISFCNKFDNTIESDDVNHYALLRKHANVRTDNVYGYKLRQVSLPNFNSKELIERYGYKKVVNFIYFLRNSRPMSAYTFFKINNFNKEINETDYMTFLDKIYKVAIQNFKSVPISTSCVAFLELLGENSLPLRLYLKSANIISNHGKVRKNEILQLFANISANSEEICCLLETTINENIHLDTNTSGADLVEVLKSYSIVIRFSALHKLQLPELFLKSCAKKDLWLPFLTYVQIYNYPVDVTCKLLQNFASKSLIEHISHAISHDIQLDEIRNQLMGERDSRKYFLSKLGVRLTDSSGSSSDMSSHSSYGSMANSINSDFLESETLDYQTDLLEVLIRCHNSIDPPKALLFAARYYKSPLLAVLANSYEVSCAHLSFSN